jgi:hypothetical protein
MDSHTWRGKSCNIWVLLYRHNDIIQGSLARPDQTDFSAVRSQSKRPDCEKVSIFGPNWAETFIAQVFINKLD